MISADSTSTTVLRIEPEWESLFRTHGLISVDDLFDDDRLSALGAERLDKPGLDPWRSRLRVRLPGTEGAQSITCYVKRFDHPPAALARREVAKADNGAVTLAGVEWTWMQRLTHDRIACATPVALGQQTDGSSEIRSVLVSREVAGRSLESWFASWTPDDAPLIRALLSPLADLIARFHRAGYVHRDLYLSHLFFTGTTPGASPAPTDLLLIDLQRVLKPTFDARRLIVKDLAALNYSSFSPLISTRAKLRWFKRYLGVDHLDTRARRMVYRIAGKTRQIARHDARRKARLAQRSCES